MTAAIDFDDLRKEVAVKHNVWLGENDPILVSVTLHDAILNRYVGILTEQNEGYAKALAAILSDHNERSKATAGKVITEASDYVSHEVSQTVKSALAEASASMRQQMEAASASMRQQMEAAQSATAQAANSVQAANSARSVAILAAVAAGLFAVVAIAALVVVLLK